jgi:hypothetical protein
MTALFLHLSQGERSDRPCDPGEGIRPIDGPYPLTPALSPWERGQTERWAGIFSFNEQSHHALSGEIRG